MSRGFRICRAKGGMEPLRSTYGRPKLTLIPSITEMGNFSFDHFHSHLLPNELAFWQFSASFKLFTNYGKLPKCKVIQQKIAVELIKLWFFFSENSIFYGSTLKNLTLTCCPNFFFPDTDMYTYRKSSKNYGPKTNEKFFTRNPNSRYERIVKSL